MRPVYSKDVPCKMSGSCREAISVVRIRTDDEYVWHHAALMGCRKSILAHCMDEPGPWPSRGTGGALERSGHSSGTHASGQHQDSLDLHGNHSGFLSLAGRSPASRQIRMDSRGGISCEAAAKCLINVTLVPSCERAGRASHAGRSAPAKRRARARVGESEGRSPSDKTRTVRSSHPVPAVRRCSRTAYWPDPRSSRGRNT